MTPYRTPDWESTGGTGMWRIGYRLNGGVDVVFWRGGAKEVEPNPRREWACFLLNPLTHEREFSLEDSLLKRKAGLTTERSIGVESVWLVEEQDISRVVDALLDEGDVSD